MSKYMKRATESGGQCENLNNRTNYQDAAYSNVIEDNCLSESDQKLLCDF
ncbi:hypothetical protein C1645_823505 [Glomus cerebriforme]|uniref:Uncharacterized protein n=1 Tax=Glomus cerebriforme TaxID=658196 RepID=A0A397T5G2_9GLOM|nr:hypothetical protein C1645_823505 [Glomus cerebriforme]